MIALFIMERSALKRLVIFLAILLVVSLVIGLATIVVFDNDESGSGDSGVAQDTAIVAVNVLPSEGIEDKASSALEEKFG